MTNRREFIKWVAYLGAVAVLPKISSAKDFPRDVLEGVSRVPKKIADASGNPAAFRAAEDDAFEEMMKEMWREANGDARYIRVFKDMALQPGKKWEHDGEIFENVEAYESFFQYRRA